MTRLSCARPPARVEWRLSVVAALACVLGVAVGFALATMAAKAIHLPLPPGWLLFVLIVLGGLIGGLRGRA